MHSFHIRRVAVLGAGVMGAQIAAHLVNARIPKKATTPPRLRVRPLRGSAK